ncbi:MAG TPA: HD domain-containing phosphohydrolase [Streptosporangiaceae bacterium]|nr:HD domain-containing phosphohydrolase [Streptosporangiaceae bacterium]
MDSGRLLLLAVSGMLVLAAFVNLAVTAQLPVKPAAPAVAFGLFIALGELLRLALPGGREAAPIAMAGAMAYALLLGVKVGAPPRHTALQVIAVAAVGMILGALPHAAAGRPLGLTGMCTRLVTVACVAFIFRPLAHHPVIYEKAHWWLALIVMTLLATLGWLIETLIGALIRADDVGARFSVAIWDEMRVQWPLGAAVGSSAVITVFAAQIMGLSELAVFLGPLLVTQIAFRRYAGIRATYLQTVRSLASVTEVGGYVESGHSRRVAKLAVAVGRELGMAEPDLLDLEYAALMHDIGQLSLVDPIPGGATVLVSAADQNRIAELGAAVIRQAGVLNEVAELVRCQNWPSRGQPEPRIGSKIIRAANAFDDMVGGSTDRDRTAAALERLRMDTAVEYDAGVVQALTEVAGRRLSSRL